MSTQAPPRDVATLNPATGEALATYPITSEDALEQALARTATAFERWSRSSFDERSAALRAVATRLRAQAQEHAALITSEMGKPLSESRAEVEKCAWACDFYAEHGPAYLAPEAVESGGRRTFVQFAPLGPVLAIMPWNYPYWQVMRFAAPTLMAGDSIVLKHAANVTGSALALARVFEGVGFPEHTFQTIVIPGPRATELIGDERIAAVTLTGSDAVGAKVGAEAGRCLKKAVLELGGSDAFVVLEDADVEAAAAMAVRARFQNAGQSCIAAKRFIVVDAVYEAFEEHFAAATRRLVVGDPTDPATEMGPMARADLRDELADQVQRALAAGGQLVAGGATPAGAGAFYEPTIVGRVEPGSPLFDEETFGPAAALVAARDEADAIRLANASVFGLGFAVWTAEPERALTFASSVQAGSITINGMTASDPRMPFGGVKRSGYGRELGGFGIREFVNVQGVFVGA
jgi:acyl-CoA reductase-like NAD-dependent aldehyde dehydrogenase